MGSVRIKQKNKMRFTADISVGHAVNQLGMSADDEVPVSATSAPSRRGGDSLLKEETRAASRIADAIWSGDAAAEAELVDRYSKGLLYLLVRRAGDTEFARDLLQETFVVAIEKLRKVRLDKPERLAGYLRGIAVRVSLSAGRRRSREPYSVEQDVVAGIPDNQPQQAERLASEQASVAVRSVLDMMPVQRDRELLTRFYVYDEEKRHICDVLELSSQHFDRVLYRAKKRLRKLLEETPGMSDL